MLSKVKILFVCHGNICRSPMAEYIMKDKLEKLGVSGKYHIESRATSTEEIWHGEGNPVYPPAKKELAKHGIRCEGKRAELFKKEEYDEYDIIVGMDNTNLINMKRIVSGDPDGKFKLLMDFTERGGEVDDPWYTGDFEKTY